MTILIKKSATASFEKIEISDTPLGKGGQGAVQHCHRAAFNSRDRTICACRLEA